VANNAPESGEYDWNNARKYLFAFQGMYMFVVKQKFIKLDPEVVVELDELLQEIDNQSAACKKR
jgi:hypothetical protein